MPPRKYDSCIFLRAVSDSTWLLPHLCFYSSDQDRKRRSQFWTKYLKRLFRAGGGSVREYSWRPNSQWQYIRVLGGCLTWNILVFSARRLAMQNSSNENWE